MAQNKNTAAVREYAKQIADAAQMPYSGSGCNNTISLQNIFDYVYAVLHNPHFRQKYGEFLKIGFARIPPPKNRAEPETDSTLRVKINDTSGFSAVPKTAWQFSVGGYLPAQKWLKSRKNKALKFADRQQFRQITHALAQTTKIMAEMEEG